MSTPTHIAPLRAVLELPCPPPTINQLTRGTLRERMRLGAAWRAVVAAHWNQSGLPKATGKRRVTLTVIMGPRQRGSDVDAYYKSLLDSLKSVGAIKDDSRKWVEVMPNRYERGPKPACRIEIEDIES